MARASAIVVLALLAFSAALARADNLPITGGGFNLATATFLSQLCAISYCPQADIQQWDCATCPKSLSAPTVFQFSNAENVQSYVTDNGADTIIAVFKGTDPLSWSQWWSDLQFGKVDASSFCGSGCQLHNGFYTLYQDEQPSVLAEVQSRLARLPSARVIIAGHSLGAAIAQLFAYDLKVNEGVSNVLLYTFGNPRVGNSAWASAFNSVLGSSPRINNHADIVPHLPPNSFGFTQAGTLTYCTDDTNCNTMPGAENDGGLLHVSIDDHGHYLGINYFNYLDISGQNACQASFTGRSITALLKNTVARP